jgi:hypothetical protein
VDVGDDQIWRVPTNGVESFAAIFSVLNLEATHLGETPEPAELNGIIVNQEH